LPYLRVHKQHFFLARIYAPQLGCGLCTKYVLLTTEPTMPVLYAVLVFETAHARIRERIIGVSAYFDYIWEPTPSIPRSQKTVTSLTKLP
jgi:hypothetical protein